MDRKRKKSAPNHQLIEFLEARQFLSTSNLIITPSLTIKPAATSVGTVQGYTPAEIKKAYGISSISLNGVTGNGAGQTIAIIDAYSDPNISSDLSVFDKEFDLAAPPGFTQESATGSTTKLPSADAGWDGEIALDVEWAHAIAPDAKIILVDASSDSMSSLMSAEEYARTIPTVSVISMSWGGSEFSGETSYDKYFPTPTGHIGITFVAASGDSGAAGGADYPAASPNVVSVGGTTLTLSSTGTVASETAWTDSEGGVSQYESTPAFQSGIATTGRSTPDVSYNADPNTGFAVYDSVADDGDVGWQEVGGTSAGTPQWSALIAIADQGRVKNGLGTLTSAQTLTELYSLASNSATYAANFTDITSGSSVISEGGFGFGGGYGGGFGGGFGGPFGGGRFRSTIEQVSATTGYDTLTGLGTPKAASLVAALSTAKVTAAAVTKTTTVSAAKAVKSKAAAAIERNQTATQYAVNILSPSSLTSLGQTDANIQIDTTAASTAAAITSTPESITNRSVPSLLSVSGVLAAEDGSSSDDHAGMSLIGSLFADLSTTASNAAAGVSVDTAEIENEFSAVAASFPSMPGIFSETGARITFRDALGKFADACAAAPAAAVHHSRITPPPALIAATAIAEGVLLGRFYARRKRGKPMVDIFSDGETF